MLHSRIPFDLIKKFQGVSWVPTIKGRLSMDLLNDSDMLLGDMDKYLSHAKFYRNGFGEHYIVATSLCTFEDDTESHKSRKCNPECSNHPDKNKSGDRCQYKSACTYPKKYNHTFRFILLGSIIKDAEVDNIPLNQGEIGKVILGEVYLIPQIGKNVDEKMASILMQIQDIEDYVKENQFGQDSYYSEYKGNREEIYKKFLTKWNSLKDRIVECVGFYKDSKVPRPIAKMEYLLTRDGMLFIRSRIDDNNKRYFRNVVESAESDSVPMHHMFKTVSSYIKFIFHKNYNHDEKNDSYMPVSNLRNVVSEDDLKSVARHQQESLLSPVIFLRRRGYIETVIAIHWVFWAMPSQILNAFVTTDG